jgi:hypothetical protein
MPRITRKWRLLLALAFVASLVGIGTMVATPSAQAGFYDSSGNNTGGSGGGDPTAAGDPDVPTGAGKAPRTDGVITTTVTPESGSVVVAASDMHPEWTMRLRVVLLVLRGYIFRF